MKDEIIIGEDDEMESQQQSEESKEQPSTEETPQTSEEVKAEGKVSFDNGIIVFAVVNVSFFACMYDVYMMNTCDLPDLRRSESWS